MANFRELMHLLVEKDPKKSDRIVSDWLENVFNKRNIIVLLQDDESQPKTNNCIFVEDNSIDSNLIEDLDERIQEFLGGLNLPKLECKFRHPLVTSRLEKLMGSNCVSLTDREFMQKLQQRILIEYGNSAEKRIRSREMDEMERVKNLVLTGKVPFSKAPPEMFDHPVMVIERYCQKLIAERRAKIKVPKVNIPNHLYWDDTIDPPSGLSIEKGHMFRDSLDRVCIPPLRFLSVEDEEDIESGYMLTSAEFETLRYEDINIRKLRDCQTVEELYQLSDEVVGNLKTMESRYTEETESKMSTQTT